MSAVDDYITALDAPQRAELERVRAAVKHALPDVNEQISYGMPAFKYKGKYLIGYASFKDHLSVFPGATPVAELADRLSDFKQSKGTIQFTLEHPLPDAIIAELVKARQAQIDQS